MPDVRHSVSSVTIRVAASVASAFASGRSRRLVIGAICALGCTATSARGQFVPSTPISLAEGRVTLGGDVSVTMAPADPGFFNYTDYDYSALRMLQFDVVGSVIAGDHLTLFGQVRNENIDDGQLLALYARIRPWRVRAFDIQLGRVPPTFGAYPRRAYSTDNPFIGYPLAYQYLTSLRADALPANADELLQMRARGWLSSFSVGNPEPSHGVPLANALHWGNGLQMHVGTDTSALEATAALTVGSLSDPTLGHGNTGKQMTGRLAFRPTPGFTLGVSVAHGPFISQSAAASSPTVADRNAFTQQALGADVEYSRSYYLIRFETVFDRWSVPVIQAPVIDTPLRAHATSLEARYKVQPGLYVAARIDHLGFSDITGTLDRLSWDAPVSRVEVGGGYSLQRNVLAKVFYQHNTRDGGSVQRLDLVAVQLQFWL
jgi:hypothetical protein